MPLGGAATFEKPTNPQSECRLFQLPAELRLKVFRLVRRFSTPLHQAAHGLGNGESWWAPLSTQALAACQLYYREA